MAVKGFESPQYVREEAQKRTFFDSFVNMYKWQHFVEYNYESDRTATTYMYNGTRALFELFMIYGLLSRSAWHRYFFNEENYYSMNHVFEDFKAFNNGITRNLDLSDPEHLIEFEKRANAYNEDFPGYFAPEGEKVNMKKIVQTLNEIKQEFGFNKLTTDDIHAIGIQTKIHYTPFNATKNDVESLSGKNKIGTILPKCARTEEEGGVFSHS